MGDCVISNLIARNVVVGDHRIICVVERSKVGRLNCAAIRILASIDEAVERVDGVLLNGIVGGERDELGDVLGVQSSGRLGAGTVAIRQLACVCVALVVRRACARTFCWGGALTRDSAHLAPAQVGVVCAHLLVAPIMPQIRLSVDKGRGRSDEGGNGHDK